MEKKEKNGKIAEFIAAAASYLKKISEIYSRLGIIKTNSRKLI